MPSPSAAKTRYIALKYGVRDRDLGSTVEEAIDTVNRKSSCPPATTWTGPADYESQKRSSRRLASSSPHHHADLHHPLRHVQFLQVGRVMILNVSSLRSAASSP